VDIITISKNFDILQVSGILFITNERKFRLSYCF